MRVGKSHSLSTWLVNYNFLFSSMTKKSAVKRKVDKCRGTRAGALGRRAQWRLRRRSRARRIGRAGGARPAPSSRRALIELGLSFDFERGERAVHRPGETLVATRYRR